MNDTSTSTAISGGPSTQNRGSRWEGPKLYNHPVTCQRSMVERSRRQRAQEGRQEAEEVISRIVKVIEQRYRPESIILFGSHAYGTPTKESDIDLLIVKDTRKPFHERYAEVSGLIRDVRRGWAVSTFVVSPSELRDRLRAGDQFFKEVMSRGRRLYGPEGVPPAG